MNVRIEGQEYSYVSDYPNGWANASVGYFKGPVTVGMHKCFVKRFDETVPEQIPGWKLLGELKRTDTIGLPDVYDMVNTTENDTAVCYVFYKYYEGETLDKLLQKGTEVKLKNLAEDLLGALQSIHRRNHWYTGFSEKHILCEKSGSFLLVGLDAARPDEEPPGNGVPGNEDHWSRVFQFYKELQQKKIDPAGVNGRSLNYLQVIFLILRLKLFFSNKENEYNSPEPIRQVPSYLNDLSTLQALQQHDVAEIKKLITEKVVNTLKVTIRETRTYFVTDYPNDTWKKIAGDYFKAARIHNQTCFVKRFETKTPENIPGWQLMNELKGKNEQALSRLYDIVGTRENGRNVFYVFYEFIEGQTLDKIIAQGIEVNLEKLSDDLFKGIQSLQKRSYWFADFIEKNIFQDKNRGFVLIDLDSAQPASVAPSNDMDVSMEYWIIVLNFYTKIPPRRELIPADLYGITLNYLQIIFLILRLRIYQSNKTKEYQKLYDHLPDYLNRISPQFKEVFDNVFQNHQKPPEPADINRIRDLIREKILPLSDETIEDLIQEKSIDPVVHSFTVGDPGERRGESEYAVESGKPFIVNWSVEKASALALYRDGEVVEKMKNNRNHATFTEVLDDSMEKKVKYTLVASNETRASTAASITITIYKRVEKVPVIKEFKATVSSEFSGEEISVLSGETFSLSWLVEDAREIELQKDGAAYRNNLDPAGTLEITELAGVDEKSIRYTLIASNGDKSRDSVGSLTVKVTRPAPKLPVIHSFGAGKVKQAGKGEYAVVTGEPFTLHWEVEHVNEVTLKKDGELVQAFHTGEKIIELTEKIFNGQERRITFTLEASNEEAPSTTASLILIVKEPEPPVILEFRVANPAAKNGSKYVVRSGRSFTLKWDVENALHLELHKKDEAPVAISREDRSVKRIETIKDGIEEEVRYTLVASNNAPEKASAQVVILVKEPKRIPVALIMTAILLLAVLGGVLYYYLRPSPAPPAVAVFPFKQASVTENDTITILGQNLPVSETPVVKFENEPGLVLQHTPNSLQVLVPRVAASLVDIAVSVNDTLFRIADDVAYTTKRAVDVAVAVPPLLQEIWHDNTNRHFLFVDVPNRMVYYSAGDPNNYEGARINQVKLDHATGTYILSATSAQGEIILHMRNLTPESFEVFIARNSSPAKWDEAVKMSLYYDNDPLRVYLPAVGSAAGHLEPTQQIKFDRALRAAGDSFSLNVFHANRFIQAPDINELKNALQKTGFTPLAFKEVAQAGGSPFERNYLSVTRAKKTVVAGPVRDTVEVARPAGVDLGYLQFDSRNYPDEASKKQMNRIAKQLAKDPNAKITFYATWYYSNNHEEAIILTNIFSLKNYLTSIGIPGNSRQVDTKISASRRNEKYLKRIRVIGIGFPADFMSAASIGQDEADPYKAPLTSIDIMKKMVVTLSHVNNTNWKVNLQNNSNVDVEKVTVELSYRMKYDGEMRKESLTFENSTAGSRLTVEAPFLAEATPVDFLIKSVVRKEY